MRMSCRCARCAAERSVSGRAESPATAGRQAPRLRAAARVAEGSCAAVGAGGWSGAGARARGGGSAPSVPAAASSPEPEPAGGGASGRRAPRPWRVASAAWAAARFAAGRVVRRRVGFAGAGSPSPLAAASALAPALPAGSCAMASTASARASVVTSLVASSARQRPVRRLGGVPSLGGRPPARARPRRRAWRPRPRRRLPHVGLRVRRAVRVGSASTPRRRASPRRAPSRLRRAVLRADLLSAPPPAPAPRRPPPPRRRGRARSPSGRPAARARATRPAAIALRRPCATDGAGQAGGGRQLGTVTPAGRR